MKGPLTMRDVFWNRVYELAKEDRNVVLVAADLGAPALDKFRRDLPGQFVNAGIAEQDAMLLASGLALRGKKVYVYAIATFITMRCYEQIRLYPAGMDLPVTIVGVGAGICYPDSGPTHHTVEDISILRVLPHMTIYSPSDNRMTRAFADMTCSARHPNYVRLDRAALPDLYPEEACFTDGISVLRPASEVTLAATGCGMVRTALEVSDRLKQKGIDVGVLDAYTIPIRPEAFFRAAGGAKKIYTLEEHTLPGGMGSQVCELVMDAGAEMKVRRFGFDFSDGYCYIYGDRSAVWREYGLDAESICAKIERDLKTESDLKNDA